MPGSSTTPGHPGTRAYAPVCVAFHLRKSVGTRDMNLYEAQWLAYVLPCRRFAAALTDDTARLRANVDRYSFIASDFHRLLVAGLPAHCERFCTLSRRSYASGHGGALTRPIRTPRKQTRRPCQPPVVSMAEDLRALSDPLALSRTMCLTAHSHADAPYQ